MSSIKGLMKSRALAVLATYSGNSPYTSLVGFAFSEDLKEIYFATFENTSKYRNISRNPRVSLLIDTRENSASDFKEARALTVLGEAGKATGSEKKDITTIYFRRFPRLEGFIKDPDCAIIKITADKYILAERFQKVTEMEIK